MPSIMHLSDAAMVSATNAIANDAPTNILNAVLNILPHGKIIFLHK